MARRIGAAIWAALKWHQRQLQERPVLTNSLTGATLMCIGDSIAQRLERDRAQKLGIAVDEGMSEEERVRRSWTRTAILTTWSLTLSSPFWVKYYRWLAFTWPNRQLLWVAGTAVVAIPFNSAFFIYGSSMEHIFNHPDPFSEEGRAAMRDSVRAKLDSRLVNTLVSSMQIWPAVNCAMFYLVPLEYRNLFSSCFALGWNVFLSLQHGGTHPVDDQLVDIEEDATDNAAITALAGAGIVAAEGASDRRDATAAVVGVTLNANNNQHHQHGYSPDAAVSQQHNQHAQPHVNFEQLSTREMVSHIRQQLDHAFTDSVVFSPLYSVVKRKQGDGHNSSSSSGSSSGSSSSAAGQSSQSATVATTVAAASLVIATAAECAECMVAGSGGAAPVCRHQKR